MVCLGGNYRIEKNGNMEDSLKCYFGELDFIVCLAFSPILTINNFRIAAVFYKTF